MNGEAEAGEGSGSWSHKITKEAMKYGAIKIILWGLQTTGRSLLWFMTFLAPLGRMTALSSSVQGYLLCVIDFEPAAPDRYSHTLSLFLHCC